MRLHALAMALGMSRGARIAVGVAIGSGRRGEPSGNAEQTVASGANARRSARCARYLASRQRRTHSLDPALSSAAEFEQRVTGVIKRNLSFIVDPPDGHIPYQPWAAALQKALAAAYENPTRPEHVDTQTRCLVPGVPRLYYFPTFRILQPAGSVVFVWDEYSHVSRDPLTAGRTSGRT